MLWIKEVEMVEAVDDLKSSHSIRGTHGPNFEVLDAKIASALNRIIHKYPLQEKGQSGGTKSPKRGPFPSWEDRSLTWSTRTSRSLEPIILSENYADLFTIVLRNDDIQEFDSKWDGILLSKTKIPSDDVMEGLYKLRIRESEKLKTVLELYNMETHQKKLGPDYHRMKAMVKRSIEQDIRNNNFGTRSENFEKNAEVKNRGTKQRVQRILGDGKPTGGSVLKETFAVFRHDISKRAKMIQPNPSPSSFMRQSERNASRTRSPRGKSPKW